MVGAIKKNHMQRVGKSLLILGPLNGDRPCAWVERAPVVRLDVAGGSGLWVAMVPAAVQRPSQRIQVRQIAAAVRGHGVAFW
jgi:hypothetical protein